MTSLDVLDPPTLSLIGFAAAIAQGDEPELRKRITPLRENQTPAPWIEELLLQSVLMVGYPRTLIAVAAWRKLGQAPVAEDDSDSDYRNAAAWTRRGEETCAVVYGDNYTRLRENIRRLHPLLDAWMITEGYGRTIGRPGLDLLRRELCTGAQMAVLGAPRQLHSHLRGALNAGASFEQIEAALAVVNPMLALDQWNSVKELWRTVRDGWEPAH
jgi:4-carboxymuconolactone decarboxylase